MGNPVDGVAFPVAPLASEMDENYRQLRDSIILRVKNARVRFITQANIGMIELYWEIGNDILHRQNTEGWGAKVIDRLSKDLKDPFPEMSGFATRNLGNMKKFAATWS